MILRHKFRQISSLHVYHHATMVLLSDLGYTKYSWAAFSMPLMLNALVSRIIFGPPSPAKNGRYFHTWHARREKKITLKTCLCKPCWRSSLTRYEKTISYSNGLKCDTVHPMTKIMFTTTSEWIIDDSRSRDRLTVTSGSVVITIFIQVVSSSQ